MNNQCKLFFVFTLMGISLCAQDWDAIHAKLARADAKAIIAMMTGYDVFEREAALAQIARDDLRPELTRAAAAALATLPSPDFRIQLITVLAERNDPAASPAIRKALSDTDEEVRKAAIAACGQMKDDKAADELIEMYKRTPASEDLREALRRIPNPSIDRYLVSALKSKTATNQAAVLDLLAARHYPEVYTLAMNPKFFDGADMTLMRSAAAVIRTYAPEGGFRPLLDFAQKLKPQAVDLLFGTLTATLTESDDKVSQERHLAGLLQDSPPDFVPVLTALLGVSQGPLALSVLSKRLESGDVDTRKDAVRNLGKWNNEDALPALVLAGKNDRDLGVQNLAWRMLTDVAKREDKMRIKHRVIAVLEQAIWFAPRQVERTLAFDALKLYVRKNDSVRWLLDRIETERLEFADEVKQIKKELNVK